MMKKILQEFDTFHLLHLILNDVQDYEICKNAVVKNGFSLPYIKNRTYEIEKLSVENHGWTIKYIKNPPEELQLIAVKKYALSIEFIKNPSLEVCLAAIEKNPYVKEILPQEIKDKYNL